MFEGKAPYNVPVIVEIYTDNVNRTAPEIRVLFKRGQLGTTAATNFYSTTSAWLRRIIPTQHRPRSRRH